MVDIQGVTHIRTLPDEVLIEIFERIPFDCLHRNVKRVCGAWRRMVNAHFRYPRVLHVRGEDSVARLRHLTATSSQRISLLKLTDAAFDASVMARLKKQRWTNLRTLIVRSTWTSIGGGALVHVADLNHLIDSSPKLRFLKIRECWLSGDLGSLVDRVERRKITKLALLNRYLVVENVDRLYELRRMEVFRVYCHFFNRDNVHATLDKFLANNGRTLNELAVYAPQTDVESAGADDAILSKVASSCGRLSKLTLAGRLNVSAQGLVLLVDALPRLRNLKLEVCSTLSTNILTQFLRSERSLRKLRSLKVSWYRPTNLNELESIGRCSRHLTKLSLEFWQDDGEFLLAASTTLTTLTTSGLRELRILSTDLGSVSVLPSLTAGRCDLVGVKFVLALAAGVRKSARRKNIETYLKSIEWCDFCYEYSFSETRLTITLTRRTQTQSYAVAYNVNSCENRNLILVEKRI